MNPAIPEPGGSRRAWALWCALIPAALVVLPKFVAANEALLRAWSPGCIFHRVTGLHCPGCGATRACFALARGDVALAFRMNPLLIAGSLIGLFFFGVAAYERFSGRRVGWAKLPVWGGWLIVGLLAAFWVLRNIPAWPFTLLAPI